jgi:hypothetical protein
MFRHHKSATFALCVLLSLPAQTAGSGETPLRYSVVQVGKKLYYKGEIVAPGVDDVQRRVGTFDTLVVSSFGGNENPAVDLGLIIYENRISVEIVDVCLSACANAILPAAAGRVKLTGR